MPLPIYNAPAQLRFVEAVLANQREYKTFYEAYR